MQQPLEPATARSIMVTKVVTLRPDQDVFDAIELLLKHRISGAPVVSETGTYLGVFSESCCMSVLVEGAYEQLPTTRVDAFMHADARTITEEMDLLSMAQIFLTSASRRLPVLRDEKLVGQVSRRDVLQAAHTLIAVSPDRHSGLLYLSSLVEAGDSPI